MMHQSVYGAEAFLKFPRITNLTVSVRDRAGTSQQCLSIYYDVLQCNTVYQPSALVFHCLGEDPEV